MRVLGVDPGSANLAWALVESATSHLIDRGCIRSDHQEWQRRLSGMAAQFGLRLDETHPDLVSIESTNAFTGRGRTGAQMAGQAIETQRTEQLIGDIKLLCQTRGIPWVMVTPAQTLSALGLRQRDKHTDGDQSQAARRVFRVDGKWLATDHHEARAGGAALKGLGALIEQRARERA